MVLAAVSLASCGGGGATGGPAVAGVGPSGAGDSSAARLPEGPEAKAARRFEQLAKELEELGSDKPINSRWLADELQAVLALDPNNPAARFNLVVLNLRNGGSPQQACQAYEEILDDAPDFGPAAENLAHCYVEAGKLDTATRIYQEQMNKDPKALTSRLAMARILQRQGKHKPAIGLCRKVLQRKADAVEAFRVLAESYQAMKDPSMAELIIGRGLKIEPDDVELHYLAAQLLLDRGELAAGINKLKHVLRLKPNWLKVRAELAEVLISYNDWGNAAPHFETVLKEAPGNRAGRLGLAVCYKGMGRYDEADKLFDELLRADSNDADALWNKAMLYWHNYGRHDQAIALLQRFEGNAPSGDEDAARVARLVKRLQREKKDTEARRVREERERKRTAAIAAACDAVAAGRRPPAAAIGGTDDRIRAAWDLLLVTAVTRLQEGDTAGGQNAARCALAIVPKTPGPGMGACAQLRVNWVQLQDQAGMLTTVTAFQAARRTIAEALECDPENPDAQVFHEQLGQLIEQLKAEGATGAAAGS
jgi:tetratricopeptide (TPR) repeat protein